MIVDLDSWIGRIADVKRKRIADECSLYRAVVWGLIKHIGKNILFPLMIGIGLLSALMIGIELGTYPGFWAFGDQTELAFVDWMVDSFGLYLGNTIGLLGILTCFVLTVLPFAIAVGGIIFILWVIWNFVIVELTQSASSAINKATSNLTALKVISTGVSNWHNGFCKKVEIHNPAVPAGFVDGARVFLTDRNVEGIARRITIDHTDNTANFELEATDLLWFNHGIEDYDANYRWVHLKDIQVL